MQDGQKTREGCGCFRSVQWIPRKTPGKSQENCWNNLPKSQNAFKNSIQSEFYTAPHPQKSAIMKLQGSNAGIPSFAGTLSVRNFGCEPRAPCNPPRTPKITPQMTQKVTFGLPVKWHKSDSKCDFSSEGRKWGVRSVMVWFGASPEVPKYLFLKGFGTSGRKIGAPQKCQIPPRQIWPPICGPLISYI